MIGTASACKAAPPFAGAHDSIVRRMRALAVVVAAGLLFQPTLGRAAADRPVTLLVANEGAEPLRCMILFAHFVVTEAGTIRPGADLSFAMFRQDGDGALWIPRADGRRMMIETIDCGSASRWAETRGQISLLPARAGRDARYRAHCHLDGVVVCNDPAPLP